MMRGQLSMAIWSSGSSFGAMASKERDSHTGEGMPGAPAQGGGRRGVPPQTSRPLGGWGTKLRLLRMRGQGLADRRIGDPPG